MLSGEKWNIEASESPWADEAEATASMGVALDWMLERKGACDTILCFDGRSSSIRALMEEKMAKARYSTDIWIIYQPRREAVGRKIVFAARNREVGWVSFPVARTNIATQERSKSRVVDNSWETSTFSATFSGVVPLSWGQLPSIALADKERVIGKKPPVPSSKLFDTDLGCPLCWQEVKPKELWVSLLEAANADDVVELAAGNGVTARACLSLGIPWCGLCWNSVHCQWLNNVLDLYACELIVEKKSPLHEQDLAQLVNTHFSDVLQQVKDRDNTLPAADDDEEDDEDDSPPKL